MRCIYVSDNLFQTINMLTSLHSTSHIIVNDNLVDDCNVNDWIIEMEKPLALDNLVV